MRIANRDRIWLLGGVVVALVLLLVTWLLLINGQNNRTDSVKNEVATAQGQVIDSTRALNQLRADSPNLDNYKAALAAHQAALPTDAGLPAFLRELHAAGDLTGVGVVELTVGDPAAISTTTDLNKLYSIGLSVVATGPIDNLTAFVKQLQDVQPRAVLITGLDYSPGSQTTHAYQLTVKFEIFTAPADGASPTN